MAKGYIPKRVLGVRVPKRVRCGRLAAALGSTIGQNLAAEAIFALAVLAVSQAAQPHSVLRRRLRREDASPGALIAALAAAADAFAEALQRGPPSRT